MNGRYRGNGPGMSWLIRGVAGINVVSVVSAFFFLTNMGQGSLGERMQYIHANATAWNLSWILALAAAVGLIYVFTLLLLRLDRAYRPVSQLAWMIGVVGGVAWVLHDWLQIMLMPLLSFLFLEVPTSHLADYVNQWEKLLVQLAGVFSFVCLAISGLIFTGVMFQSRSFPRALAVYSLILWTLVLAASIFVRWMDALLPWVLAGSLLLLVPWYWQLSNVLCRSTSE
jgi:hypothetical protein